MTENIYPLNPNIWIL